MKRRILKVLICLVMIISCMAPIAATAASKPAYILKVSADYARMRKGPYGSYGIITTLRRGAKVLYGGQNAGEYCKVYTTNGTSGYVYKKYLSTYGAVKRNNVYMTKAAAPFYKRSGSSLKRSGSVAKNQFVLVYKRNGDWVFVKSLSGRSGYMKAAYLKRAF